METEALSLDLTSEQFRAISERVHALAGIRLRPGKENLVRCRLGKRIRALQLPDFGAYLRRVQDDTGELAEMVDALTTNKTSFFRESAHFDYVRTNLLPEWVREGRALRLWSAGCSTGEEPYTLAMVLREGLPQPLWAQARILATDISARALARARSGVYAASAAAEIPAGLRRRFLRVGRSSGSLTVAPEVTAAVRFARLNLMDRWPMRGPFDAIFCRNVMIYFDRPTRQALVGRLEGMLRPGGVLFVGHSESLTGLEHSLTYVRPAAYRR